MLATIRMNTWLDGVIIRHPKVLSASAVRDALMMVTDDENRIDEIFTTVEITGACHLYDDDGDPQFLFERVLHS